MENNKENNSKNNINIKYILSYIKSEKVFIINSHYPFNKNKCKRILNNKNNNTENKIRNLEYS